MRFRIYIAVTGILLLTGIMPRPAAAQHYVGVRGGYGGGIARFDPPRTGHAMRFLLNGGPSFGLSWKYYSPELGVGGLQADLQYVTRGYRELSDRNTAIQDQEVYRTEYRRTIESIELPFFWQLYFYTFQRRLRAYFNAGVYASYMVRSRDYTGPFGSDPVWADYPIRSVRDNPFGYGLVGGFGFSVQFNRFEVFAEGRYEFAFSDAMKSSSKYPLTPFNRTPVDMINVSVGVYYRLGKGGILAPPAGTNRPKESWDSIPVGRNREQQASGNSGASSNPGTSGAPQPPVPNR